MDTTDAIADLDGLVMQAWKSEGIDATRRKVENYKVAVYHVCGNLSA